MNMLTNKVRYDLLQGNEQAEFSIARRDVQYWNGNSWINRSFIKTPLSDSSTYRLKLKEGEWYAVQWLKKDKVFLYQYFEREDFDGVLFNEGGIEEVSMPIDARTFRPATKTELRSVTNTWQTYKIGTSGLSEYEVEQAHNMIDNVVSDLEKMGFEVATETDSGEL